MAEKKTVQKAEKPVENPQPLPEKPVEEKKPAAKKEFKFELPKLPLSLPAPKEAAPPKPEPKLEPSIVPNSSATNNKELVPNNPSPKTTSPSPNSFSNAPSPATENFIDDLYKLSRAKSSSIPKLLMLIAMVLVIGGIVFYYYQSTTNKKPLLGLDFLQKPPVYTPVTKQSLSLNLEITNPDDELLVYDKTVIVSGKTNPNARIIISDNDTFTALAANDQGEFSKVVDLNTGVNQITIYAFDENGNSKTDTRTIYYSEDKL